MIIHKTSVAFSFEVVELIFQFKSDPPFVNVVVSIIKSGEQKLAVQVQGSSQTTILTQEKVKNKAKVKITLLNINPKNKN